MLRVERPGTIESLAVYEHMNQSVEHGRYTAACHRQARPVNPGASMTALTACHTARQVAVVAQVQLLHLLLWSLLLSPLAWLLLPAALCVALLAGTLHHRRM